MQPVQLASSIRAVAGISPAIFMALATPALAENWVGYSDSTSCPSYALAHERRTQVFSSKEECQIEIDRIRSEQGEECLKLGCDPEGSSAAGGSSASHGSGNLVDDSVNNMVTGALTNNVPQAQAGMLGLGLAMLTQGLKRDPQAEAAAAREKAKQEEQKKKNEAKQQADANRRAEEAKARIMRALKGYSSDEQLNPGAPSDLTAGASTLALKGYSDDPLVVGEVRGTFNTTSIVPVQAGVATSQPVLGLKSDSDLESKSAQARLSIDTSGEIMHGPLPPPPPTPEARPRPPKQEFVDRLAALRTEMLHSIQADKQALTDQLATLQRAPTPDPAAINKIQVQLDAKKEQEKKLLDLTTEDPGDADNGAQPGSSPAPAAATPK